VRGRGRAWLAVSGVVSLAVGATIVLVIEDVIVVEKYAPPWVLWVCAAAASGMGLLALESTAPGAGATWRLRARTTLGVIVLALFLVLSHWAVLGPGERVGRMSGTLLPWPVEVGDRPSRIVAGVFTLVFDLVLILGIVQWIRRTRAARAR
jgi:hypothetical protein